MVRSGGDPGRLAGVPVSIKDNICTAKMPTTCASKMLEGYVSPYEATVVERLRSQGAVIVGKTNMDEFAMGMTTEFSAYGPTLNPARRRVRAGRLLWGERRLGGRGGVDHIAGLGHGRLGAQPRQLLRGGGAQAHLRGGEPVRPGVVRQQHRAGGGRWRAPCGM